MTVVAVIDDEQVAGRILDYLRLPSRAPPRGPPWVRRPQHLALRPPPGDGVDPPSACG